MVNAGVIDLIDTDFWIEILCTPSIQNIFESHSNKNQLNIKYGKDLYSWSVVGISEIK